jgi:hypothetical protein
VQVSVLHLADDERHVLHVSKVELCAVVVHRHVSVLLATMNEHGLIVEHQQIVVATNRARVDPGDGGVVGPIEGRPPQRDRADEEWVAEQH